MMKYTDRNDITSDTKAEYDAINAIYSRIKQKRKFVDTTDLMVQINTIINDYVEVESNNTDDKKESKQFDISSIDFDMLRREFSSIKKKNLVMNDLEELIRQKLDKLLFTNPNRVDYYERYQSIIEAYNSEQNRATIEKTFMDLMNLANNLDNEEKRYVREGFSSDEELSLYDMLFREDLSKSDIEKIKAVAIDMLKRIKEKVAELDHWTDKQETRAEVDNLIRDILWIEMPECYDQISLSGYRDKIYTHVYTRYSGSARVSF